MTDSTPPYVGASSLPIQPTGSGVADLEIAYEQMKLTEVEGPPAAETVDDNAPSPSNGSAVAESEAHPS